jgi:uncharacterized membrane protein
MNVHSFFVSLHPQVKNTMNEKTLKFWNAFKPLIAVFMMYGGVQHFLNATYYTPFVPDFLIFKTAIIYISGFIEIAIGLLLLIRKYEGIGAFALFVLMLVFLPLHVWDVFSDTPAIGSHQAALVRLPVQFVLIAISWKLQKIYFKRK